MISFYLCLVVYMLCSVFEISCITVSNSIIMTLTKLNIFHSVMLYALLFKDRNSNSQPFLKILQYSQENTSAWISFCVCVKRVTLCNYPFFFFSFFSFFASLIHNIGDFGAKKYFTHHRTANSIQLVFGSILFQIKLQWKGVPQRLFDKYSRLFICRSLK